jgi:FMN phosphatase YigB (HAD superfamily)
MNFGVQTMMRKLYHANTGDDLAEGMFDADGTLLDMWSPNDACWREYFEPFMERLGFEVLSAPDWMEHKLRLEAMELWGLTEEQAGLTEDEEGE